MRLTQISLGVGLGIAVTTLGFGLGLVGFDKSWVPALFPSGTAILLGIWIRNSIERQSTVGRVPRGHVAASCKQINDLTQGCLTATGRAQVAALRRLSNEITWLLQIPQVVQPVPRDLERDLERAYFLFKKQLTGGGGPDWHRVGQLTQEIKMAALKVEICFTARVFEHGVESEYEG